jgi:DNA polymerase-3 subunit epsilon
MTQGWLGDDNVYCAVDVETTGIKPFDGDRIVEIAIVPTFRGKIVRKWIYSTLVNSHVYIPALIEKVHGISNNVVSSAPTIDKVLPKVRMYSKDTIFVFHNSRFDLTFLDFAAKEIGEVPMEPNYIDTIDFCLTLYEKKRKLDSLAKEFHISDKVMHRALDDAVVTAKVFNKMAERIGYENIPEFIQKWRGSEW